MRHGQLIDPASLAERRTDARTFVAYSQVHLSECSDSEIET